VRKSIFRVLLVCFSLITLKIEAQQVPHYHHYFINPMTYNPAATGLTSSTNAFFMRSHRNLGFQGGNIVNVLTVDGSLFENKLGLGLAMFSDEFGPASSAGGFLSASYKIKLASKSFLRFGLAGGAKDYRINFGQAIVQDPNDPALIQGNAGRKIVPDVTAGLLLQVSGFRLGLTGFQLIGSKISFKGLVNETEITGLGYTFARHFMATTQYEIKTSEKLALYITPYASVKYVTGAPIHYEGGFTADFKKWGWINACYKAGYGVTGNIGVRVKQNFHVGYAYDVVINSSKSLAGLNQELLIGYTFPVKASARDDKRIGQLMTENDSLRKLLTVKVVQNDSLVVVNEVERRESIEVYAKMEKEYLDSISRLNELLKKRPVVKDTSKVVDKDIKRSKDDHFLELNGAESPQGLYTVYGAFSKFALADQALERIKRDFPEARIIYN
jgi:type IX secretion system PorP/SprF family membrane protein